MTGSASPTPGRTSAIDRMSEIFDVLGATTDRPARLIDLTLQLEPQFDSVLLTSVAYFSSLTDRVEAQQTGTAAFLIGTGVPADIVRGAWHLLSSLRWNGDSDAARPASSEAIAIWHAGILERLLVATHIEYLSSAPIADRQALDSYYSEYRSAYLLQPLALTQRFWHPEALELLAQIRPQLEEFLQTVQDGRIDILPVELHALLDSPGLPKPFIDWRSLLATAEVNDRIADLRGGADPLAVRNRSPRKRATYVEFRERLRRRINEDQADILGAVKDRFNASADVAYEKFLEGDTLYKADIEAAMVRKYVVQARAAGVPVELAEDIVTLLLSRSRLEQEDIFDQIAAQVGMRRGVLIDSELRDASKRHDYDRAVAPLSVSTNPQYLFRELQLVTERRIADHMSTVESLSNLHLLQLPGASREHLIAGSRGLSEFVPAVASGSSAQAVVILRRNSHLHIGHYRLLEILAAFERCGIAAQLYLKPSSGNGSHSTDKDWEGWLRSLCSRAGLTSPNIVASDMAFAGGQFKQISILSLRDLVAVHALTLRASIDSVMDRLAPIQWLIAQPQHTVVIGGLDVDATIALSRIGAARASVLPPAALFVRMAKSMAQFDKADGAVMDHRIPATAIGLSDAPDRIASKLRRATTGGRATAEEQSKFGGNPDPRICTVSNVCASVEDSAGYRQRVESCRSGSLSCGACKTSATAVVVDALAKLDPLL